MTTLTMDHHGPSGAASTGRPSTWPPGHAEDLRDPVSASSSLAMIYIVSGPQTRRGTPPPLVGASVVSAALWCMFAVAVINTIMF
mgnify:CR=1 FL=1